MTQLDRIEKKINKDIFWRLIALSLLFFLICLIAGGIYLEAVYPETTNIDNTNLNEYILENE